MQKEYVINFYKIIKKQIILQPFFWPTVYYILLVKTLIKIDPKFLSNTNRSSVRHE